MFKSFLIKKMLQLKWKGLKIGKTDENSHLENLQNNIKC
jgi:hypothetical protein